MTYVLGVSCYYHDSAAALVTDGRVVAAAQEERFTREKHDYGFPDRAIDFCLRHAGIRSGDLDYVVFYEKPLLKYDRILRTTLQTVPRSWRTFGEAMIGWFDEKLWIKSTLQERLGLPPDRVLFTEHHVSHAASAFFCSPFEDAAILTVDGVGEWATATAGVGTSSAEAGGENRIVLDRELRFPHSVGLLYSAFTAWLGFRVNNGEYKVMGMASYGEPRYRDRVHRLLELGEDGAFRLNMEYFSYHHSPDRTISPRFVDLFGPPRAPGDDFVTPRVGDADAASRETLERNQYYADVAASLQKVTEEILIRMARDLHRRTGKRRLCLAGGVALNSVANARLHRETPFEELYVQPAAGDAGGAVGAALYVWHVALGNPRSYVMDQVYLGEAHGAAAIEETLTREGLAYREFADREEQLERVVEELRNGRVVGWYQGRFEWGPRALGNRSILADPRRSEMKDVVNRKIKFREPFRPFAPVVPAERAAELLEGVPATGPGSPTDFMLMVLPWRRGVGEEVPAVNHMGTGRVQTIRREQNPAYHRLVELFGEATGVPVLLNTSFNVRGEPIVSSPSDAIRTFRESGIDLLAMDRFLVERP